MTFFGKIRGKSLKMSIFMKNSKLVIHFCDTKICGTRRNRDQLYVRLDTYSWNNSLFCGTVGPEKLNTRSVWDYILIDLLAICAVGLWDQERLAMCDTWFLRAVIGLCFVGLWEQYQLNEEFVTLDYSWYWVIYRICILCNILFQSWSFA